VPSLKELYGPQQCSFPWEEQQAEIVRFWTDSGDCWGFLFHHVSGILYSARDERLLIDWALGTIVVTGPRTLEFYEQFSNHRATLIRADGKDILSVKMHLNSESRPKRTSKWPRPKLEAMIHCYNPRSSSRSPFQAEVLNCVALQW
jgi:hypothetical protein